MIHSSASTRFLIDSRGMDSQNVTDGYEIRRSAVDSGTSLVTNIKQAMLLVEALHYKYMREKQGKQFWGIDSWTSYHYGNQEQSS